MKSGSRSSLLAAVAALLLAALASAQESTQTAPNAQYPAATNTFELDAGARFLYSGPGGSAEYYRIVYKGGLLSSRGTPFKYARGLDLLAPQSNVAGGDTSGLSLRLENNTTTVGGGLFDALGVSPLSLAGLESLNLRGTLFAGGDLEGERFQIAGGFETAPLRLPGLANTGASNWLVFGVQGQHQEGTDTGTEDETFGLITARAFAGKAFGWRKSADVQATAGKLSAEILENAPTYAAAVEKGAQIETVDANARTTVQKLFLDALGEAEPEETDTEAAKNERWRRVVRDLAYGFADAVTDQPTLALYAEASGWYSFAGNPGGDRLKALFTATADYWFLPRRDDVFLRVRYENGFERATPTDRKNHLMVAVALRF